MIYFVQLGTGGPVKIGYSANPKKRIAHLATHYPQRLIVLCVIPGDYVIEHQFHEKYAELRIQGEWFRTRESHLIADIEQLKAAHPNQEALRNTVEKNAVRSLKKAREQRGLNLIAAHNKSTASFPKPVVPELVEFLIKNPGYTYSMEYGGFTPEEDELLLTFNLNDNWLSYADREAFSRVTRGRHWDDLNRRFNQLRNPGRALVIDNVDFGI